MRRPTYGHPLDRPRTMDERSYASAMDEREYGMRRGPPPPPRSPYHPGSVGGYAPRSYHNEEYDGPRRRPLYDDDDDRHHEFRHPGRDYLPPHHRRPLPRDDPRHYHPDDDSVQSGPRGSRLPPRQRDPRALLAPPRDDTAARHATMGNGSSHHSSQGDSNSVVMVDISPGVQAKLRRMQETMDAVAKDYYTAVCCLACQRELFCIADVEFFLCPDCKVIIEDFDHTCPWTGTAIGKKNMGSFQCFVGLVFACLILDIFLLTVASVE